MMGLESLELEHYQGPGGGGEDESLETSKATSTEQAEGSLPYLSKEAAKTPKQEGAKGSNITKPLEIGGPLISLQKNPFIKKQPKLNSAETPGSPEKIEIMKEGVHFDTTPQSPAESSGNNTEESAAGSNEAASERIGVAAAAAAETTAASATDAAAAVVSKTRARTAQSMRSFFNRVVNQINLTRKAKRGREEVEQERIEAWKRHFSSVGSGAVPGVMGIRNHGNTCFINAVLQCLSYTDILAEYFVLDAYKSDLKRKRKRASLQTLTQGLNKVRQAGSGGLGGASALGGKGEVTEQLATLFKSLWSLQYDPEISIRFKSLVDKHASQYKGGRQHDAQEFLLWLLDQVHEDLNLATRRRHRLKVAATAAASQAANGPSSESSSPRSDEVLAADALAAYMRANNSFVVDVFQAQFRSSLTCPTCQQQSNTFDPFLCVSLPIPQKQLMPVYVTVLYIDQSPRQVKLGLTIGANDTIGDLRETLSRDTGIEVSQLLLAEIDDLTFRKTFRDSTPVSCLKRLFKVPSQTSTLGSAAASGGGVKKPSIASGSSSGSVETSLYCIEMPAHRAATEEDGDFIVLTWINVLKEGPIEKRFGSPYTIQVSRETLYGDLQKLLMKEMSGILHDDILISQQKVPLFKIRVLDGLDEPEESSSQHTKTSSAAATKSSSSGGSGAYLDSSVDMPMYTLAIEQAINISSVTDGGSGGSPPHVKFVLEWDMPAKSQVINDDRDYIEEHSSVKLVQKSPEEASSVSLQECFGLYTEAETLGREDAWFCQACNRKQEVVKRMGLWSVPDVLVVHLKRFRHSSATSTHKLTTLVEFPLESFDMRPNVSKRASPSSSSTSSNSNSSNSASASSASNEQPTSSTNNQLTQSGATNHSNGSGIVNSVHADSVLKMWSTAISPWHRRSGHNNRSSGLNHQVPPPEGSEESKGFYSYDLYAVCNHHGSDLQGGHYTATCRNPTDGHWYLFDDNHVQKLDADREVVTEEAYILFYQRSNINTGSSSSSSCASTTSSSGSSGSSSGSSSGGSGGSDHWVYRMPDFNFRNGNVTATAPIPPPAKTSAEPSSKPSSTVKSPATTAAPKVNAVNESNFSRNSGKYATLPAKKSSDAIMDVTVDHYSDGEFDEEVTDDDDEDEEETSSPSSKKLSIAGDAVGQKSKSGDKLREDACSEDVSRPIDKNDVD